MSATVVPKTIAQNQPNSAQFNSVSQLFRENTNFLQWAEKLDLTHTYRTCIWWLKYIHYYFQTGSVFKGKATKATLKVSTNSKASSNSTGLLFSCTSISPPRSFPTQCPPPHLTFSVDTVYANSYSQYILIKYLNASHCGKHGGFLNKIKNKGSSWEEFTF